MPVTDIRSSLLKSLILLQGAPLLVLGILSEVQHIWPPARDFGTAANTLLVTAAIGIGLAIPLLLAVAFSVRIQVASNALFLLWGCAWLGIAWLWLAVAVGILHSRTWLTDRVVGLPLEKRE